MKILVVHQFLPMPDRASGELRLFTILKLLSSKHELFLLPYKIGQQSREFGEEEVSRYKTLMTEIGVNVMSGWVRDALRNEQYDLVLFEFYHSADKFLNDVRVLQPKSRVIVDSVDVHFHRLEAKARLKRDDENWAKAKTVKDKEMSAYANADLVITVTEDDKQILHNENSRLNIHVLPNVHSIPSPLEHNDQEPFLMVFVGSFRHEPNADAVKYFCSEILPRIVERFPEAHLKVIGDSLPDDLFKYAVEHVEMLGFVPEIEPYLRKCHVSVAPLRFGAGMKGKIGEAMSLGLPVVTTPIGAEGFGATPGKHFLVANNVNEFVELIGKLFSDQELYDEVSQAGREFIKVNYSPEAMSGYLESMMDIVMEIQPKRLSWFKRVAVITRIELKDRLLWRFNK